MTSEVREFWDRHAATFDEEPDHGLLDPAVREAWTRLLVPLMPKPETRVVDLGCGTGSLSVLLAQAGHRVSGVDLSGRMVAAARAKAKAAGVEAEFTEGDAAKPPYEPGTADTAGARRGALVDGCRADRRRVPAARPGHGKRGRGHAAGRPRVVGREIDDERYLLVS
ncbi:class I SAM-dependent DNA methyltransferase [Lentzea sp. JNUCC 0626]|uniref:class I SAM-dependent DNA methyltransferase n=1 Tax=Lentzea sp. JNUCC 0626 TaxID=3367513 RepID=UPI003748D51D